MAMIYVTKETANPISRIVECLRNPGARATVPTRTNQADVIQAPIEIYAKNLEGE